MRTAGGPAPAVLEWLRAGTERFEAAVRGVTDEALTAPSALPGWSRAHVVTHVARNADAVGNLLSWARTGAENPMYASREQRDADIAAGAGRPPGEVRDDLRAADARLARALARLPAAAWAVPVRTAQGRMVPAGEVPWMRVREVWIHAVDLDAGTTFADLPPGLVAALLDDATAMFAGRGDAPGVELQVTDAGSTGVAGPWRTGERPGAVVRGAAAQLLGWLLGRTDGAALTADTSDGRLPVLPSWI